jgi:hypothetical protein
VTRPRRSTSRTPDWVDHAHPEVTGPAAVRRSVQALRAAGPGVRFEVCSVPAAGDLHAARRLLLDGSPAAEVAPAAGVYDQAYLSWRFRRMLGTLLAGYAGG